jgi:hypothetical protein
MKPKLSKAKIKQLRLEFKALKTKEERVKWLSNGVPDALSMINIRTLKTYYVATINGYSFCEGTRPKYTEYKTYEKAYTAAVKLKAEFAKEAEEYDIEKGGTEKHDCPACKSKRSITITVGEMNADSESGVIAKPCTNCKHEPTVKELYKMIGMLVEENKTN